MFYDIRKTGQLLGWLVGRNARTNQRLGIDVVNVESGTNIWAGGMDGYIRRWLNPHEHQGSVESSMEWRGQDDAVSSVVGHQSGSALASCSGQRQVEDKTTGHALKIWSWK